MRGAVSASAPVDCSAVKSAYPDGVCPDCGENIPEDAAEGQGCTNCGHALYSLPNVSVEAEAR